MVHGVIIHPNRSCIHLMSNMNLILRIMHLTVPCDVTVSLLPVPSSLFSPFMSVRWIFNRPDLKRPISMNPPQKWSKRVSKRNHVSPSSSVYSGRRFAKRFPSPVNRLIYRRLVMQISILVSVLLLSFFPLFLLVGLSLPLEKKSRWEMIFSFLFFFFLLPFCTRQFRNRADSLCVFECRTRRSSTKDLDLNFHLTCPF